MSNKPTEVHEGEGLKNEWDKRLAKDGEKFGFPSDVIGREFRFFPSLGSLVTCMMGTVTGLSYICSVTAPDLQVSNSDFNGYKNPVLHPSPSEKEKGDWVCVVDDPSKPDHPKKSYIRGYVFFAH